MDKLYNISKTAEILDVTPKTLRVWDKENKLKPILTSGGHRRYRESDINKIIGVEQNDESKQEICATYARVSSQKQKVFLDPCLIILANCDNALMFKYCLSQQYFQNRQ